MSGITINSDNFPVLDKLWRERVFSAELIKNNTVVKLEEACDMCFRVFLTADGVEKLIDELDTLLQLMRQATELQSDPNLYTTGPDYDY